MIVLGIETSCDETSAAVLEDGRLLSNVIYSQIDTHRIYGGVVPEIAAREHMARLPAVVDEAMKKAHVTFSELHGVAVTNRPGLAGGLIVGVSYAKALCSALDIKLIGVDHLEAHMLSPFLENEAFKFPFLGLVISGGHTNVYLAEDFGAYKLLGSTRDDAAGEAFDKVAKMLGLPYPGGPSISKAALSGDPQKIVFPQPQMKDSSFDFSFSGIKTSVLYYLQRNEEKLKSGEVTKEDVAAAFQKALSRSISNKMRRIFAAHPVASVAITGGVAANAFLRSEIEKVAAEKHIGVYVPSMLLCTDNAGMVAYAGYEHLRRGTTSGMDMEIATASEM
ncbi:MAG: tRNA (adenosine(37)-N6)-threonylcarbamoyltransferase complex transferase subunit TsaD [Spirochaetia bacterium]|nr:tRNA (adenosine(37)-N6)-threonylcarbamoyltransferase complex transferase subunit TsaD [Spirochaetia bacterium]